MNKKYFLIFLAILIIVPQVTFASWWNPVSWFDNWTFHKHDSKTEILENHINELENKINQLQSIPETPEIVPEDKSASPAIETNKTKIYNNNQTAPVKSSVSVSDQNLIYIAKIGIKISYPNDYSYTSVVNDKYTLEGCRYDGPNTGVKDGKNIDCVDYKNPDPKAESIVFGNKNNKEIIVIVPSNNKNYKQDHCQAYLVNNSHTINQISGKTFYHITYPMGQEIYCLDTPDYDFELKADENNEIRIDINKIVFP